MYSKICFERIINNADTTITFTSKLFFVRYNFKM